ncbi:50S ribosomal protein L6 [Shewanella glacialipiscicola]|uniref:Large ribosomal subunit protein uL6 n=1 Tax=Shewanella glacialipiscicola TaxID=614069 RepID=A0ABQ6J9L5_9GAMM|nr:50S ribosomal protein L6 [Shewanella glacialipiscicola]MCL1087932.1 50S ribosomal protein L6 [Shewanella glacialipiscicola]MCU7996730.1 50S ribosomal protein L6 [Shewanella glacialipiscicola]MCU8028044.1 50S ribosomal protein L6 [Shewanella glacialipiscicola]GIU06695.1 50S ribosomal protein L6 [Shewanella glacialipiscicola]GMA84138.1 50S ribosomal protein L6 [Shewanella glacialipiscicola]
MSRVAKAPVSIPAGVEVTLNEQTLTVKGGKGSLTRVINNAVNVVIEADVVKFLPVEGVVNAWAQAGTTRALVNNMVVGVSQGFERKLKLVGVGYRAKLVGTDIDLTLGFSHPLVHKLPAGVTAECPSQTDIVLRGVDKQVIGQVAAEIRGYRPPEPYKGKGVRYDDEVVRRKEAKKK